MLTELILALILGILAGTFTGLIPGIHINLVAVILTASLTSLTFLEPITLAIFIASMAITHTFIDFIPSIYLGAPDDDTFLSVLPGHQMLKQGLAHEAVVLTLYGSISALIIIAIFTPIFIFIIPTLASILQNLLPFLLIFTSLFLILREKRIWLALTIFILAGFLGYTTLNLPVKEPLLPLLTGLFGSSALIISLKQKTKISNQKITKLKEIKIPKKQFLKSTAGAIISAPLCSFLPGIGAGHAAIIGSEFIKQSKKGFIVLLGAINTIVIGLSFITLYSIGRTRTGAAVAISEILQQTIQPTHLAIIITTIIISGILAFFLSLNLSKFAAKYITKINYTTLSTFILIILFIITLIFSNLLGILVFITSTALGIFTILSGARRINLMGVLLVPTILFYLF